MSMSKQVGLAAAGSRESAPVREAGSSLLAPTSLMGVFDHDMQTDVVYCSPEVYEIYGWTDDRVLRLEMFGERTHPEDRERRQALLSQAHGPGGDGRYSIEYRVVRSDGAVRWVTTRAQTFFEGSGAGRRATRVIGAITDVTEARAARELLREREERLRRAETLARMGHFTADADGSNGVWSDGNKVLFGFSPDSAPSFADFVARLHPEDAPRVREAFRRAAQDGEAFGLEFRVIRPDGVEALIRSLVECTRNSETGRVRFFGTNLDATAEKQAETALVAGEERLRQAVRLGRLGIFDHDHASDTSYWSAEQREIWGISPDGDVPVSSAFLFVHPGDREAARAAVARAHDPRGDGTFDVEHRIIRSDGQTRWIRTRAQTYFEGEGEARRAVRTIGATADITDLKRVETDLRIKDDALASSVSGILIAGLDSKITYANAAWLRMHGYERADLVVGTTPLEYLADPAQHERVSESLLTTGSWVGEVVAKRRDGTTFDANLVVNSIPAADGAAVAFLGSLQDITERKRAEAQLRRSEAILRSVFEASKDAIVVTRHQRIVFANTATAKMYGYESAGELVGLPLEAQVPPSELARVRAINRAREEGRPVPTSYETKALRRDGSEFDIEISASSYAIEDTVYPLVFIRDVSARKTAERALRETAERLSLVFNSTSDAQVLYSVGDGGRLVIAAANDAYKNVRKALFPRALLPLEGLSRDEMLADQGLSPEVIEMEMPAFRRVIATGRGVSHELEVPLPTGEAAIVEAQIEAVPDPEGHCAHVLWVGRDVTERRRAEEAVRRLTVELERRVTERTAQLEAANNELESFAYSVSHDLRAPARAVDSYAGILMEDFGSVLDAEGRRLCGVVRGEAQRMGRLIDDLLAFSRLGRTAMQIGPVDMTALANEVFEQLVAAEDRTRITFDLQPLPRAVGDRSLLRQVWINLLANAIKFSSKKAAAVIAVAGHREGSDLRYTVTDNGAGFDMAYKAKLFGVFQRLHTEFEFTGTGVGLAIVHRAVHRHGGQVWAEGEVERGATFSFRLPADGPEL